MTVLSEVGRKGLQTVAQAVPENPWRTPARKAVRIAALGLALLVAAASPGAAAGSPDTAAGAAAQASTNTDAAPDADALVEAAFDNWRGDSSYTEIRMRVHRPDWERTLSMQAWTRGDDDGVVRFVAPPKDEGNATLKLGSAMWVFNPKLGQVIKLPASMMAQSWMGSDFSYDDLAKAEKLRTAYSHELTATESVAGHRVYTIEAVPKPDAAVVWGKQTLKVRDDGVMLEEVYFDQDLEPVKRMETTSVGEIGGRSYPVVMHMSKAGDAESWTEIETTRGRFDLDLPDYLFTLSNLRNPRRWSP